MEWSEEIKGKVEKVRSKYKYIGARLRVLLRRLIVR